ncbi:sulfatase [Streptomyces sp. NPDC001070]
MSLFTGSHQPGKTDEEQAAEGDPPDGTAPEPDAAGEGRPADPDGATGWRARHPDAARALRWTTTGLAGALVFCALLVPNALPWITVVSFLRIPVEGVCGAALLLVLPGRARQIAAVVAGLGLGLFTVMKFVDMGFYAALTRPFDPVLDWILLDDGEAYLRDTSGRAYAIAAVVGAVLLVLLVLALMTLSVVRLSRLMARHSGVATRATLVLGTAWVLCALLGVQIDGSDVASKSAAALVRDRVKQVRTTLNDQKEFTRLAAHDDFRNTPDDQLLTGLRGKDVIFAFIESYGRSAIEDPSMGPAVDATLAKETDGLRAAGYSSRSGWLTSPVAGGGSWLAHSTFLSGLWVENQQRYRSVTSSDRLTLTDAFKRTDAWRTVGIMPGVTRSWPEGTFYGLDHVYDSRDLGYHGPKFSWAPVPDQYSLREFEKLEHGKPHDKPLMSEIILVSSHRPWAPIPRMVGWDQIGDGSIYNEINKEGYTPEYVWQDPDRVRTEYRRSIQYSVTSLVEYVKKYGNKNTVLVFLGDHQPATAVTGENASHDVPVAIVAHDKGVLDRISGWGWSDGLRPAHDAPVWKMDSFRDRFLTAYGSRPTP